MALLNLQDKMVLLLNEIPVWPDEIPIRDLTKKYGMAAHNLPTNAPLAEYGGYLCWPDKKSRTSFLGIQEGNK